MSSNTFGKIFRLTTFGESHGPAIGGVIDGCPAGLEVPLEYIQSELNRRKPGQSKITTQRKESDKVELLSGVFEGKTTGTPIGFIIYNKDSKSKDYGHIKDNYRPSHADYTYDEKFGKRDYRGGGRSSARETANWVTGGAIAKLFLKHSGIKVHAFVSSVGKIEIGKSYKELDLDETENNIVRCPEPQIAKKMEAHIKELRKEGDTTGGIISCVVKGLEAGTGEPVFSKLHAELARAMLSINAVKGFEYGSGFKSSAMKGSEHNDIFENKEGKTGTSTNYSGGIQGGISNGEDIYFNVAFKPVATIMKDQKSVDNEGNEIVLEGKGRHDPCVVPRAVPIVEAMTAMVLADQILKNRTSKL